MSKRKEIQMKEQLQLQLQAGFNQLDQTVLSWLKPVTNENDDLINENAINFSNQIIVSNGKGINLSNDVNERGGSIENVTIGDFLNSNDKESKKRKNEDNRIDKIGQAKKRGISYSSNSLRALSNKIRDDKRKNFNTKPVNTYSNNQRERRFIDSLENDKKSSTVNNKNDDDSDSENEDDVVMLRKSKSQASSKSGNPKKSKRPF